MCPPPEYVKSASLTQQGREETADLHDRQFADASLRRYPIHTKAATWLSTAGFLLRKEASPWDKQIAARLQEQALLFGISADVAALEKQAAAATAPPAITELPDSHFAYLFTHDGEQRRALPIVRSADLAKAANYLQEHAAALELPARQQIAARILHRYETLGDGLSPDHVEQLQKTAGLGVSDPEILQQALLARAAKARDTKQLDMATTLEKLASAYEESPELCLSPTTQQQVCQMLDQVDRRTGFVQHYRDGVTPEHAVFGITKQALAKVQSSLVPLITGTTYLKSALAEVPLGSIRDHLGDTIANEVSDDGILVDMTKLAQVLPTLPRPDAVTFDRMMVRDYSGPYVKAAATEPPVAAQELGDLTLLADLYLASR